MIKLCPLEGCKAGKNATITLTAGQMNYDPINMSVQVRNSEGSWTEVHMSSELDVSSASEITFNTPPNMNEVIEIRMVCNDGS